MLFTSRTHVSPNPGTVRTMELLILGVGDAFTRKHFGSSGLLRSDSGLVLIDCPDPIHRVIAEASRRAGWQVDAHDIHDIVLTHLHGDHCNGLESFGFLRRMTRAQGGDLPLPRIHCPQPVADRLWERLAPAMDSPMADGRRSTLADYFEVQLLDPDEPREIAGIEVSCRFTRHPIPTIGLRFRDQERIIGWSGDTPFEGDHVDWLSAAGLVVHECNRGPAHTPIEELEDLPQDLRRRIHLIHLPDDFDPTSTSMHVLRPGDVLPQPN